MAVLHVLGFNPWAAPASRSWPHLTLRGLRAALAAAVLLALASPAKAQEAQSEYRLKAAVLYNFATFTEWPAEVGPTINLCIFGPDPFDDTLEELQGKPVGKRRISLNRRVAMDALKSCQLVFISAQGMRSFARVIDDVRRLPVLTVAESPGAARDGAMLNMLVVQGKITFEANLGAARSAGLTPSSRLLRLASEVLQ